MTLLSGRTVPQVLKMMDQPTGEEVSIVGHKFPKIRFEKYPFPLGELVISLRGPLPTLESTSMDRKIRLNQMKTIMQSRQYHYVIRVLSVKAIRIPKNEPQRKRACILNLILRNPKKSLQLIKIGVYTS